MSPSKCGGLTAFGAHARAISTANSESVNDWWEDIPDVHGDIRIHTRDSDDSVEFGIRFTDRRVSRVKEIDRASR